MHHLYPVSKGDQLCPLGFHPQVRWPTRCKRCFRDYKEHGGKRNTEDVIASTPNLSDSGFQSRSGSESRSYERPGGRSWTSSQNLSTGAQSDSPPRQNGDSTQHGPQQPPQRRRRPASWTSTPDLNDDNPTTQDSSTDATVQLPRRRHTATIVQADDDPTHGLRPPLPPQAKTDDVVIYKTDSLAERYRKMQLIKRQNSSEREQSFEGDSSSSSRPRSSEEKEVSRREKSPKITITAPVEKQLAVEMRTPKVEFPVPEKRRSKSPRPSAMKSQPVPETANSQDVRFLMHVKSSSPKRSVHDDMSSTCTETTQTTVVAAGGQLMDQEVESLKQELDVLRQRCEKAERDKSDLMLRRLASKDTMPNKTAASEALKLQKQVNELNQLVEDLRDEKKKLTTKVQLMSGQKSKTEESDLRKKLEQAQKLCESLRSENDDFKKEIKNMEQEMDEIQDNFREEQVDEFSHIKKDLDQTTKNCRILSFKLKKADRRIDQLELERKEMGANVDLLSKVKLLEEQIRESREQAQRLELEKLELMRKKTPNMATIGKSTSADGRVARGSLIRSGSQDDPGQLQLDLHASMEREADLREQLKFAQEEGDNLRKKSSRIEDENESLMMQLKKMATRSRTRKLSPTSPSRLSPVPPEKDEGISDEEDPVELRILLELNEQEASVLRRKVEELETENNTSKKQIKELEEKLIIRDTKKLPTIISRTPAGINTANEKRIRELEESTALLNKKLAEQEKELVQANKRSAKIKSDESDTQTINFKRKLEIVEQEAQVLRSKLLKLEQDHDKLQTENKKLSMQAIRSAKKEQEKPTATADVNKIKEDFKLMELERDELKEKLKAFIEASIKKLPTRTPKKYADSLTKPQIKKLIEDLELEVVEARAIAEKVSSVDNNKTDFKSNSKLKELEATKTLLENQLRMSVEEKAAAERALQTEKREKDRWEAKVAELDGDLSAARRNAEKVKLALEKEVASLKTKALTPEGPTKKLQELKKQIGELETRISEESQKYKDLTGKYELLEEEHVLTKAQLTTEKDKIQNELNNAHGAFQDFSAVETKLKSETAELTRKLRIAEGKVRDMEKVSTKSSSVELERNQMRSKLLEVEGQLQKLKRENEMNVDKALNSKRETDELRRKLDDFERLDKAQRTLNDINSELENEVRKLKMRLENSEVNLKSEVASTRLRYEHQVKNLQMELASMQSQCERFKRDRDSFKQLLEGAQKKIAELKQPGSGRQSRSSIHSDDDDKSKIQVLEQQVGCLEDELSECRLDQSKLKTELVSEKTASEIKISEMQSTINEYEEERLLSGGSKIPGTKTRIELSWQKEREEQQRLLQETSTLARDLRQTLFEVERERDKERLETRRKLEQLKKNTEDEMEESRRKVTELQCDLLELRDAHAKLRTANEKLRREREALARRRLEQDGEKKIAALLQTVDELVKVAPELKLLEQNGYSVRSKSPAPNTTPSTPLQVNQTITRLAEASEELRRYQRLCEDERQRERLRRGMGMHRAASTEHDPSEGRLGRGSHNSSLTRKTLSLDQSLHKEQNIWKQDGSMSSMQSIDSDYGQLSRDPSMDSRLSGGSTQSDLPRGTRKIKKRSLMGKLKSLAKSRGGADSDVSQQGSDSDLSLAGELRGSKQNIKGRLSGMFRRSGSASGSYEKITTGDKPVAVQTIVTGALPASTHPPPSPSPKPKVTKPVVATKPPQNPNNPQVPLTATLRKTNIKLKPFSTNGRLFVLLGFLALLIGVNCDSTDIALDAKATLNHRLDSLNLILYMSLLTLTVLTIWLFKHHRVSWIHETGLAVIYGLIVGAIIRFAGSSASTHTHLQVVPFDTDVHYNDSLPPDSLYFTFPGKLSPNTSNGNDLPNKTYAYNFHGAVDNTDHSAMDLKATFDPEIFFNIILPPIIFHAGYSLKRKYFFRNLGAILTFAIIGTALSVFAIGWLMYGFVQWLPKSIGTSFSFLDMLFFGALISPTDPLTILAILHDKNVDVNLYALIFGESVLNDAVALVLTGAIEKYGNRYSSSDGFEAEAFFRASGDFLRIFTLSLLVGASMGCLTSLLTKFTRIRDFPLLESALFVLMSYSTFLLAEASELTGVVAVLFCGICQAHYTYNNLSDESRVRTKQLFELLNFLAENFIFSYIGVSMFTFPKHLFLGWFILAAFLCAFIGRAISVYPLSFLLNLGRKPKIHLNFQHMLFFSGMRGAISFAMAIRNTVSESRQAMATTTSLIVIATVIIQGGAANFLLSWLKIPVGVDAEREALNYQGVRSDWEAAGGEPGTSEEGASNNNNSSDPIRKPNEKAILARWWGNFDSRYMKPLLTHSRPTLLDTLPVWCAPLARLLTTTEQLTQERSNRRADSDSDLCLGEDGTSAARAPCDSSTASDEQRRNSVGRVSIRLLSDMATYKPHD